MINMHVSTCLLCGKPVAESLAVNTPVLDRWDIHCSAGAWYHITGSDDVERLLFVIPLSLEVKQLELFSHE